MRRHARLRPAVPLGLQREEHQGGRRKRSHHKRRERNGILNCSTHPAKRGETELKRLLAASLLAGLMMAGTASAATENRIGTVDLQRAVTESKEGSVARADLLKKTEQLNAELRGQLADAEKVRAELEKESGKLSVDERAEKQRLLQKKMRDFQNRQREAQEEIKQAESDSIRKIIAKFGVILEKLGADGDYSAILDRNSGVFYAGKKTDVTPLLVKQADQEYQR
ncbi:MAG TPA: hypothetical protein DCZ75_09280 [Geobacter sp.]|nr:hypothetical protein [Geobacter sp.]